MTPSPSFADELAGLPKIPDDRYMSGDWYEKFQAATARLALAEELLRAYAEHYPAPFARDHDALAAVKAQENQP